MELENSVKSETIPTKVPPLGTLYINPTRFCNLLCKHCWIAPPYKATLDGDENELSVFEIIDIIESARDIGLHFVKLTGGEPMLKPGIELLIKHLYEEKIGIFIETNGLLLDKKMAKMFYDFGVHSLSVSLDSHIPEIHDKYRGVKGAFEKTVTGIKNLVELGIHPEIIICLFKENVETFETFISFAKDLQAGDVKVNIIVPIGRGNSVIGNDQAPSVAEVIKLSKCVESLEEKYSITINFDVPPAFKPLSKINNNACGTCGIKGILGLLADGTLSMCGIGNLDKRLHYGNIRGNPELVKDIWADHSVLKEIREKVPNDFEGICGMCLLKDICLGKCRAEVYKNTGSITAPFWFCQEAYEEGLFPTTRLAIDHPIS